MATSSPGWAWSSSTALPRPKASPRRRRSMSAFPSSRCCAATGSSSSTTCAQVSAVVDYLHRITDEPPVAIGDEPVRYFELAHADEHAPPTAPAWIEQTGATRTPRPILPKAPASAKDASGHVIFRVLLEDIAESEFTGEEQYRLEILARLDRFSVAERANLGRLLVERLEAAANVEAGTTTWQHRLVIQDDNRLHLFFSVGDHI